MSSPAAPAPPCIPPPQPTAARPLTSYYINPHTSHGQNSFCRAWYSFKKALYVCIYIYIYIICIQPISTEF